MELRILQKNEKEKLGFSENANGVGNMSFLYLPYTSTVYSAVEFSFENSIGSRSGNVPGKRVSPKRTFLKCAF